MVIGATGDRFFELSPDLLCVLSLDGRFLELNKAWTDTFGYPTADLKSFSLYDFVHVDDRDDARLAIDSIEAGPEAVAFTIRFLHQDGTAQWLSWNAAVHGDRIFAIAHDATERIERENSLSRSLEQRRELLARLLSVREEERTQLARVVHDEMGQVLTGLMMDLVWLQNHLEPEQTALLVKTESMSQLINKAIQSVRQISFDLRPPILDDLGLIAAIEWQLQELQKRTGLHCELVCSRDEITLDIDGRTTVFRIFQEILTNVARHANATQVRVSIKESEEVLILSVHDNGRGISQEEIESAKSIGLLGLRERAQLRGGDVGIQGVAGHGTTVTVRLPLDESQSDSHERAAERGELA